MARNTLLPMPMIRIDRSQLNGEFHLVNDSGFAHSIAILRINNVSDNELFVSFDGIHIHDYIFPQRMLILPAVLNQGNSTNALFSKNTQIYLKSSADLPGSVYIASYYQPRS